MKFVLRPAPKQGDGLPRIRFGLPDPGLNVEICESWACETFVQR